jgi:hypothetical protein
MFYKNKKGYMISVGKKMAYPDKVVELTEEEEARPTVKELIENGSFEKADAPKEEPKKVAPKKEEPKVAAPQKVDPKAAAAAKAEAPKVEAPKEEPKVVAPQQADPKAAAAAKAEPKKDEKLPKVTAK